LFLGNDSNRFSLEQAPKSYSSSKNNKKRINKLGILKKIRKVKKVSIGWERCRTTCVRRIAFHRKGTSFFLLPISAALRAETFLDTFGGLDGVDVGVELGVVSDGFPLDQGVGEGERFLEVLSREGREESGELVSWVLGLVESVFNGGISTFVLFEGLVPSTVITGPLVSGGFDELDTVDGGHELVLGKWDGLLVLAELGEPVEDVGLGHLFEWWEGLDVVEGDGSFIDLLVNLLDVVGDSDFVFSGLGLEGSLLAIVGGDWDLEGFELCLEVSDESLVLDSALIVVPVDGSVEGGGLDVVSGEDVRLDLEGSHELLVSGSSLSEKLSPVAGGWDYSTRHISVRQSKSDSKMG